jgi:YggT family protein
VGATSYDCATTALSFVTAALPQVHLALGLLLGLWTLLFLFRIVLTWYPQVDLGQGWGRWVGLPTELVLAPTRRLIQPIGGVDVAPVVWVGLVTLLRELLVGQQGLITQAMLRASAAVG